MEENPIGALPIFALLADSFIEKKGRKPLVTQAERGELWAGSGLVDGVILLPDKNKMWGGQTITQLSIDQLHQLSG